MGKWWVHELYVLTIIISLPTLINWGIAIILGYEWYGIMDQKNLWFSVKNWGGTWININPSRFGVQGSRVLALPIWVCRKWREGGRQFMTFYCWRKSTDSDCIQNVIDMQWILIGKRLKKTMERSTHFEWENSLFLWPFSSSLFCMFTRGYANPWMMFFAFFAVDWVIEDGEFSIQWLVLS